MKILHRKKPENIHHLGTDCSQYVKYIIDIWQLYNNKKAILDSYSKQMGESKNLEKQKVKLSLVQQKQKNQSGLGQWRKEILTNTKKLSSKLTSRIIFQ